jgi:hypothetical protein
MGRDRLALILFAGTISIQACGAGAGTAPSSSKKAVAGDLQVTCNASPTLRCTAFLDGEGDVTAQSHWAAAESFRLAMAVPFTAPSTAVDFPVPGTPRVLRPQNVYIRAEYDSPVSGFRRNIALLAYALSSDGTATPLTSIQGLAFNGPIGGTALGGVTVEIIDGEGAGKQALTSDANGSYMIEFLHLNAPFTVRASKVGYVSDVKAIPPITGGPYLLTQTSIHFSLSPAQ